PPRAGRAVPRRAAVPARRSAPSAVRTRPRARATAERPRAPYPARARRETLHRAPARAAAAPPPRARPAAAAAGSLAQRERGIRERVSPPERTASVPSPMPHRHPLPPVVAAWLLALVVGSAAALLAVRSRKTHVPIMERHDLLRDDADLLRERQAAHRPRVHDDRGRHPDAPPQAAWGGDLLPHGRRRARDEGLARRRGAGPAGAGVRG